MSIDDHNLIVQVQAGERIAIKKLYDLNETYWFRLCLRYAKNRSEAQDIFQEGVTKVFHNIQKYDPSKGNFNGWSNRVIVNEALKYLKKHHWQHTFEDLDGVQNQISDTEDILGKITTKELVEVIQKLPTGYRVIFNMYVLEGYSHKEIAAELNISLGTSKSQLSKARKALQQKIKILFL